MDINPSNAQKFEKIIIKIHSFLHLAKPFYCPAFYMGVEKDKEGEEKNETEREMLYCPVCGSPNVEWLLPQMWSKWVCKDCGYIGVLILEDGKIAAELRKEWKEKHGTP